MKKNLLQFICLSLFVFTGLKTSKAQCGFTGLNANYCTNSAPSTLTPGLTGGTFIGNGVSVSAINPSLAVFNPAVAGPGTHTVNFSTCSATYAVTNPSFAPSSTVGTAVSLGDDVQSTALPIGFAFKFFCVSYTNFYISSNGFIDFTQTGQGCCTGQALPNNTTPNNLIAACWNDLHPGNGGSITYTTIGTVPNRTLLVSFVGVPYFSNTPGVTFQIKLFETSNIIEIHSTSINNANNNNQTMGIVNLGGIVGYPAPGRNATTWTATNDCYRWTPGTACNITQTTSVFPTTISVVGNNSICIGSTASLTATGNTSYTWSTVSNSNSITVSPTVNTTYSVSGTNAFGCTAGSAVTVTVDNTPTITAVNANSTTGTCPNTPVTLYGTGATSYSWTGNITNNVPFTTTVSNTYSVVGSNACGSTTAAISVSIHPLPPVTASVNNATICSGSSVILNAGGAVTYTWTGPTGTVPNNTAFSPTSSGNYTVRGTSVLGCTASAVSGVTVLITPSVQPVASPTSVCLGVPAVLSSIGATSYNWSPGGLSTANVTVTPLGTTTYTLVRSNGACSFTSNVTLVISPLPFANVSATPSIICAGDPVALNVFGGITYTWLPNGFTASNFTLFPNNSVSYTVIASNGSCTATGVQQVSVNPSPQVGINSSSTTVCAGGGVTLTATGNAATYTWLPGPGNGNSYVVNPTTISQYTLIGGNASNCTTQQTQLIIANPVPPLVLNSSLPYVCTGTTAVLSIANATLPGVTYSWSSNSGPGSTSNVSPTVTTTYFASAVTNSTGCSSAGSLALTVNISTFVVTSPTAICRGSSAVISAAGAANSYIWNVNGATTPSISVSPSLTTNYVVTGITGSCSSTQTVPLIVNLLPNVQATAVKSQICRLENGTLTATGANSYTWNTTANLQSIIINSLTVTTTFTVTGTDVNNCVRSATVTQFVATCLGVDNLNTSENIGLFVYPNPNNGNFSISCGATITFDIINTLGQVVGTFDVSKDHKKEVIVNNLPNGVYFLSGSSNGVKVNKKIVIDK